MSFLPLTVRVKYTVLPSAEKYVVDKCAANQLVTQFTRDTKWYKKGDSLEEEVESESDHELRPVKRERL